MTGPCNCGGNSNMRWPVLHHMPCAYVGPSYDFALGHGEYTCPKCNITFKQSARDSEVLGYAFRCTVCGAEWLEDEAA